MEKYSKWKDPATGIHPFLENRPKVAPQSVVSKVLQMIPKLVFVPILFVVRVLFLTTLLVWYGLFELIALLIPISFLRRYSHSFYFLSTCTFCTRVSFYPYSCCKPRATT
eukprot:c21660_g1_i1.p1 GENE.c21660_g1_i1~~c21660_g1_i1.p1  ORF type:complete len:118 (+),score=12.24 c21660_g1_i1:26-355(+)